MSIKEYYKQLQAQTGIKAFVKKKLFNNLLNELSNHEENMIAELTAQKEEMTVQINKLEKVIKAKFEGQYEKLDYYDFENRFRGPVELIKERQSIYLPYLKDKQNVLDFGCGRGEFLELMHDNAIKAKGVDIYQGYVDLCRSKGFDVV